MIPEYNRKSLAIGIPGLLLEIGCTVLVNVFAAKAKAHTGAPPDWVVYPLLIGVIVGAVLFITGLCYYAKSKGYSAVLGILGLLSCIGLLILAVLPDKAKDQSLTTAAVPGVLSPGKKRIIPLLLTHCRQRPMSRAQNRILRQRQDLL